ncbi:SDR family oxidoreductase [Chitinibacter bivalviorum]|uniref:SDR family oxidoreductase n=1 Tax=Chitinibacter bivalviorum TaxID=2739434 RepID=A0A7H9BE57_9NEIS|nr:SDR family oxidoreductase [Chitinibacter bivalviorum]QLG87010.1 SDR family oxidoreductase [Chitinibacter bivalviorum]
MRILLTGASGFVGQALLDRMLVSGDLELIAAIRKPVAQLPSGVTGIHIGGIEGDTDWRFALEGVDYVIHCAARAHVMNDTSPDPLAEFRKVNVEGTLNLARQALAVGVRRFVFISSIGVNGNSTTSPFSENDKPNPVEPYAISKFETELGLQKLVIGTEMELVIIRPPLVYGPNAPGNFGRLIRTVAKGLPLPLGAIQNKRSLVSLDNLVDLIWTCIIHPAAANQVFLVGDGEDLSTTELLQRMAKALGVSSRLIPVPMKALKFWAGLLGKADMAQRLCGSLQVDISKARAVLGWTPPVSVDKALHKTAQDFLARQRDRS